MKFYEPPSGESRFVTMWTDRADSLIDR